MGVGCGTHARGIAQANVFTNGGQIEIQLPVEVSGIALKSQSAPTGAGGQRFDVGVKYGLFTAQLALALSGQDRENVLTQLVNVMSAREMLSVKGDGA